jgi:hypothetical protein
LTNTQNIITLGYPTSANIMSYLNTGEMALLYKSGLDLVNIENLRDGVADGYYYASPFATGYPDRVTGLFQKMSPSGSFPFSFFNTQAAVFNSVAGPNSKISANDLQITKTAGKYNTVAFWMYWSGSSSVTPIGFNAANPYSLTIVPNALFSCMGFSTNGVNAYGFNAMPLAKSWHFITALFFNGNFANSNNGMIYVDGVPQQLSQCAGLPPATTGNFVTNGLYIGSNGVGSYFSNSLANVQIYNTSLTPRQINQLYTEGIAGLPISSNALGGTNGLSFWLPLNGNAKDYSGYANSGIGTAVIYQLISNYTKDSILQGPWVSGLQPIPGVGACSIQSGCISASSKKPMLYLGTFPLGSSAAQSTAYALAFNGAANSYYNTQASLPAMSSMTVVGWVYTSGVAGAQAFQGYATAAACGPEWASVSGTSYSPYWNACACAGTNACGTQSAKLTIPTNTWMMIAYTANNAAGTTTVNALAFAPNGMLYTASATGLSTFTIPSNTWYIGSYITANGALNGQVTNVQVYANVLTTNQITQLYYEGIQGLPLQVGTLQAWWPLDGDAQDYSGNGYSAVSAGGFIPFYPISGLGNFTSTSSPTGAVNIGTEWGALGLGRSPS